MTVTKAIKQISGLSLDDPPGWATPAIRVGDFIFLKGFIGTDPATGRLADTVEGQVRFIFQSIKTALEPHGANLEDVVQMTMYFTNRMAHWPILDRVRREIFKKEPPTSTGVGVTQLHMGADLEIDAIAVISRQ